MWYAVRLQKILLNIGMAILFGFHLLIWLIFGILLKEQEQFQKKGIVLVVQLLSKVTELTDEYKERVNSKQNEDKNHFST